MKRSVIEPAAHDVHAWRLLGSVHVPHDISQLAHDGEKVLVQDPSRT
jgi:hypothetical protein